MNEDMILSEYIDGELPADVAAKVTERLSRDADFQARHRALLALRQRLVACPDPDPAALGDLQSRVWQRLQRNLAPRPSRTPAWMAAVGDLLNSRISLPVPALAGLAAAFLLVGSVGVISLGGRQAGPAVADGGSIQSALAASVSGQAGVVVDQMGVTPASLKAPVTLPVQSNQGSGMAVTIEVENLRQLLSVLENNQGVREFTIQMPRDKVLQPLAESAVLPAAELETGSAK